MVSRRDKHCLSASGAEVAEPAQRATELARRRGLQGHRGADLGAISPGRAAAGGGHSRLAEGERAFLTIMYQISTQRAQPGAGVAGALVAGGGIWRAAPGWCGVWGLCSAVGIFTIVHLSLATCKRTWVAAQVINKVGSHNAPRVNSLLLGSVAAAGEDGVPVGHAPVCCKYVWRACRARCLHLCIVHQSSAPSLDRAG